VRAGGVAGSCWLRGDCVCWFVHDGTEIAGSGAGGCGVMRWSASSLDGLRGTSRVRVLNLVVGLEAHLSLSLIFPWSDTMPGSDPEGRGRALRLEFAFVRAGSSEDSDYLLPLPEAS